MSEALESSIAQAYNAGRGHGHRLDILRYAAQTLVTRSHPKANPVKSCVRKFCQRQVCLLEKTFREGKLDLILERIAVSTVMRAILLRSDGEF